MEKKFGLLGHKISYSFSQKYFIKKFNKLGLNNYSYKIFDISSLEKIKLFLIENKLNGLNVTIPYKESIIPFLDDLTPDAKKVKAINCINFIKKKKIGYNTDIIGFKKSLLPLLKKHHDKAIILGDGGAAKAVSYVLKELDIKYLIFSRKGKYKFEYLTKEHFDKYYIWIQTTPVGTFPNYNDILPIPTQFFNSKHLVYDLIYNPIKTKLLREAEKNSSIIKNGLEMLYLQAESSFNIWENKFIY